MNLEIERKFLVSHERLPLLPVGVPMIQGYLASGDGATVRCRCAGTQGFLTIKGPSSADGLLREEFEYSIPFDDARRMIETLCGSRVVSKVRHKLMCFGQVWEIDVFEGSHRGLVLAEAELGSADDELILPDWAGREVTADARFRNSSLAEKAQIPED